MKGWVAEICSTFSRIPYPLRGPPKFGSVLHRIWTSKFHDCKKILNFVTSFDKSPTCTMQSLNKVRMQTYLQDNIVHFTVCNVMQIGSALSCTVLYYPALPYTVLHFFLSLSYTVLHFHTLFCTVNHFPALSATFYPFPALSCTVFHYPALSFTVLHCPALSRTVLV